MPFNEHVYIVTNWDEQQKKKQRKRYSCANRMKYIFGTYALFRLIKPHVHNVWRICDFHTRVIHNIVVVDAFWFSFGFSYYHIVFRVSLKIVSILEADIIQPKLPKKCEYSANNIAICVLIW